MIETALQPRFRVLSQIKKGRCLGLDDTQVKRIMPKDLPDKTDGIEDPQIKWLIEKMIEAKKEKKDSLDAKMWGYSSFDSSAPYDIFDFHVSRHRDGPDEILGGYQGHGMADCAKDFHRSSIEVESSPALQMPLLDQKRTEGFSDARRLANRPDQ